MPSSSSNSATPIDRIILAIQALLVIPPLRQQPQPILLNDSLVARIMATGNEQTRNLMQLAGAGRKCWSSSDKFT